MRYPLFLAVVAALVGACLWRGASVTLLGFVLAALVLAACIWAVLCHLSALRRDHDLAMVHSGVWWRGWVGGHVLRCLAALPLALWTGAAIALSLLTAPLPTLAATAVIVPVAWIVARIWGRRVDAAVVPAQRLRFVLPLVIALGGASGLVTMVVLQMPTGSLAQDVAAAARYTGPSLILGQAYDLVAIVSGVAGQAGALGIWGWLLRLALAASVPMGLATVAAAALVPPALLIGPSGGMRAGRLALTGFVAAIGVWLVLSLAAVVEGQVQIALAPAPAQPPMQPLTQPMAGPYGGVPPLAPVADAAPRLIAPGLLPSDGRRMIEGERIGDLICPPGTNAALTALQAELDTLYARHGAQVAGTVRAGFDAMRANVPGFLDWYYSLGAEYLRTVNLLIGSGEAYLAGKVDEYLDAGTPLATVDAALAGLAAAPGATAVTARWSALVADCGGDLPRDDAGIAITAERAGAQILLPVIADRITLESRLTAAGLGGIAAGVGVAILAKVGAKLAVSSAFKAAAAALVKIAGSKALGFLGGMGLGAAAGGAGGSVVPGAGTAAGAVAGGIIGGIAVMLGVDFTLLKLEEAVSRDAFQAEIVAAIDATEAEVLDAIGLGAVGMGAVGLGAVGPEAVGLAD